MTFGYDDCVYAMNSADVTWRVLRVTTYPQSDSVALLWRVAQFPYRKCIVFLGASCARTDFILTCHAKKNN